MKTTKDSKYLYVHDEKKSLKTRDMKDLGGVYAGDHKWKFPLEKEAEVTDMLGDIHIVPPEDSDSDSDHESDPDYLSLYASSSEDLDESEIPSAVVKILKQRRCKHMIHREDSAGHSSSEDEEDAKCSDEKKDCLDVSFKRQKYTKEELGKEQERLRNLASKFVK